MRGIVDIDNVVSDWVGWVIRCQSEKEPPQQKGVNSGLLEEMWPDADWKKIVADPKGYSEAFPIPGARDCLWQLSIDPDIRFDYISAAPEETEDIRRGWFESNMMPITRGTSLIHLGGSENKIAYINEFGGEHYDFIIDDHLYYLDAALFAGIPLRLVYNYKWNQDDGDNHIRIYNWKDALSKILLYKHKLYKEIAP